MARYRFLTKEEMLSNFGTTWRQDSPSFTPDMDYFLGKLLSDLDVNEYLRMHGKGDYFYIHGWSINTKWIKKLQATISVRFVAIGDKQISIGQLYLYRNKFYIAEKIEKNQGDIIVNHEHELSECQIVDESIKKDLL